MWVVKMVETDIAIKQILCKDTGSEDRATLFIHSWAVGFPPVLSRAELMYYVWDRHPH
jgi:hypothetical protein